MWNGTIEETGVTLQRAKRAENFGFLLEKLSSQEQKQVNRRGD